MVWSPAIQSVVHRPAALASAKSVWKMQNRKPHSRPPESESFRKGPRKLYFNKICRRYLNKAWDWFGELALNQTHSSDSPETIRASSICKHPGPLSRLLKWGGLKGMLSFVNYVLIPGCFRCIISVQKHQFRDLYVSLRPKPMVDGLLAGFCY